jgi:TolB protein
MSKSSSFFATLALAATAIAATLAIAAQTGASQDATPSRLFTQSTDIGFTQPGSTTYNPTSQSYTLTGGGADMWGTADAFHVAWTRVSGDAALTATVAFPPGTHPPNEKAVLIFRQSLDPDSAYADVAIHADGHVTLQWRASQGAITQDATAPASRGTISIARQANRFTALAFGADGKLAPFAHVDVALHDPIYVGIGVCAHDAAGLATVTFTNVRLGGVDVTSVPATKP